MAQSDATPIRQPTSPEMLSPEQKQTHRRVLETENPTVNPGDRVDDSLSLAEKAQQVAIITPDITAEAVVIPTYFIVDNPDGSRQALHHVKDAEAISDVIRQARTTEDGQRVWW